MKNIIAMFLFITSPIVYLVILSFMALGIGFLQLIVSLLSIICDTYNGFDVFWVICWMVYWVHGSLIRNYPDLSVYGVDLFEEKQPKV